MNATNEAVTDLDQDRDLVIARRLDVPRDAVWQAWTDPAILAQWWCPKPWLAEIGKFRLAPGGAFDMTMRGPDGEVMHHECCFLDVAPKTRIVFTTMLKEGWRPVANPFVPFTAIVTMTGDGAATQYEARVMHDDPAERERHEEMGFYDGWGTCIAQLEQTAKGLQQDLRGSGA